MNDLEKKMHDLMVATAMREIEKVLNSDSVKTSFPPKQPTQFQPFINIKNMC